MNGILTFEDFDPAAFLLEHRVQFLHSFKTSAQGFAQSAEDSPLFKAHRKRLAFNVNNYRLRLMTSIGKMSDATSEERLYSLLFHMTLLYEGRADASKAEVLEISDNVVSAYESLVDYLQEKRAP